MQKEGLTIETADYLTSLLQRYEETEGGLPADAILPPIPVPRNDPGPPKPAKFLVPAVILWDPLSQVPNMTELPCPHEIHDNEFCVLRAHTSSKTNYGRWKASRGTQDVPRVLYCCDGSTLLVSRMYTCKKGHKIISHDPRVIENIPSSFQVPFFLLHRTGFTRELANWVHSCVFAGMTFHEIENVLIQRHREAFEDRKCKFNAEMKAYLEKNPDTDPMEIQKFPEFKMSQVPSLETIMSSIVHMFEGNEQYYIQRMSEWSAKRIMAGYYFKVATTIGEKLDNGKWTTHFKNIYTVMNEKGQVIAWKFSKEKDLNEVKDVLIGLQQRFQKQGKQLEMILVPDCCESRVQFKEIFGADIPVKLELTKAIHRVVRKIPAKRREDNQLTKACVRDFALCLRYPSDRGDTRQEDTPSPIVITENLDAFVSGWKEIIEGTERVLTLAAQRQIVQLRSHITIGCLSDIPVCSTSENVADLQNILRPVLERKFLNADMALALISTLLYVWNERKANQLPIGALVRPISKYRGTLEVSGFTPSSERFGIVKADEDEASDVLSSATYSFDVLALQCLILNSFDGHKEAEEQPRSTESNLSQTALKKVIARASNLMSVWELLKTQAVHEVSINPRLLHLMACSLILFSRNECAIDDRSNHEARLSETLRYYQLMVYSEKEDTTEADGFFTAVSSGLDSILRSDLPEIESVKQHLASIGYHIGEGSSLEDNVSVLRQLISDEWLASEEEYSKLLVSHMISFSEEAQAFRNRGYFKAEMSNLLPIAAAKVLRVPIIVFTSLQHFPIVPVVPSDAIIIGSCVHVAYNASGFGGFFDVGTYISSSIVLPKLMTDPLARRRDSRKRYREKMARQKLNQPPKKRGKKPKSATSQEETQKDAETGAADDSVVSEQDDSLLDSSAADITEQGTSLEVSVAETEEAETSLDTSAIVTEVSEEGETSLDTSAIVAEVTEEAETSLGTTEIDNDVDEGVEAAANLIEMAYSEAGVIESTMEESITESPIKIAIVPGTEPLVDEGQMTLQPSETELVPQEGELVTEEDVVTHTIAEDVINQSINGKEKELQAAEDEEVATFEPVAVGRGKSHESFIPRRKPGLIDSEAVVTFSGGVNIQKQTFSCSCGRGSGKNQKRTMFCLTLKGGYLTRCACYRNASGCSHRCRCYLCCNPYGTAQEAKATKPARQVRRFRPRHKVQVIKSRLPGLTFATPSVKSEPQKSKWMEADNLAFECLVAAMSHAGLELTPEKITGEYDNLCVLSKDEGGILGNILQPKGLEDITEQLEVVQKNIRMFENLYKKQTELNWFQGMEVVFSTEVVVSS